MANAPLAPENGGFQRALRAFERAILIFLMVLLMVVVGIAALELAYLLVKDLTTTRDLILDIEEMFELFGFFLLVLIGIELLLTLKSYLREGIVHVEVVLEVALTALAQKIIILDASRSGALSLLGLAALVLALAAAFWLVRVGRGRTNPDSPG
jgi:uncharacterized membrane protein (DUF373 family)